MNPDFNQLNLEHLKTQAKDLLKQWNDADATVQRKLAEAQHVIAQKYNYRNWAEMKHAIEAFLASPFDISNWVLTVMMRQTFGSLPAELEGQEFWSSLCRSDLSSVRRFIESGQFNVIDKGGPLKATPLVYACCSYAATSEVLGLAKYLIEKGADVNETYEDPNWPGSPLGALYGACGRQFNVELARLLLDTGAEINDEESVYHSTESADHSCLELLLSRGAKLKGTNGLLRALDFDRIEAVQLLLDAGADPNDSDFKENALHHAIRRGRSGEFGLLLAKYGVNLRGKSIDGFDVLTHAGLRGGSGMVEAMAKLGLSYPLDEIELFATYVSNGELERADQILATSPKIASKLTPQLVSIINDAAWAGDVERMKRLLQYGWPVSGISKRVVAFHGKPATPLHIACFIGNLPMVKMLVENGAELDQVENQFKATPIGWAAWSSVNNGPTEGADHLSCVRFMLEAGAKAPEDYLRGNFEIDQLIERARMKVGE